MLKARLCLLIVILAGNLCLLDSGSRSVAQDSDASGRSSSGLLVLYDFSSDSGPVVKDRSRSGQPVDLKIADMTAVKRSAGSLEVIGDTMIASERPPARLVEAVRRSGEISIEAWIQPANAEQKGPARIITLSKDSSNRNFTLGQEGDTYDVRFRSAKTSTNGLPSVSTKSKSLNAELVHVVYTRERSGRTRIFLNGKPLADQKVDGSLANWDGGFKLALGNEFGGGRLWKGTYHLVAVYGRELQPAEVTRHFKAGPKAETPVESLASNISAKEMHFRDHVAPLIAQHCLECHDTAVKDGGLDLSRKMAALAGGESGKVLLPGNANNSPLWEMVQADEMPQDRPPLSDDEKQALKMWINDGAVWNVDVIDPSIYAHGGGEPTNWLRRLTVPEYIATVQAATGVDIADDARELLPRDVRADGFSNTAYNLGVDLKHVEAYSRLAEIIVSRMDAGKFAGRFSKKRRLIDDDMRDVIAKMGHWLLRGPLSENEIVTYRGITTSVVSAGGDFEEAVSFVIEAMLQSPRFLYRVENQVGDGTSWPVGNYELASRLSYLLWGGPPDETLMKAAESGALSDSAQFDEHVKRMLADPRAISHSRQFVSQWLNLDGLANLAPNPDRFPDWSPELAADMRDETVAYFEEIVWKQNRPMADLINADVTFLTPRLAKHYGLTPPKGEGVARYDLSKHPSRGGLLTQGSVLTVGGDNASMVSRGLFVLHDLLRGVVKDPPPCVDTTPVASQPGLTQRSIAESRIADASCGGCHAKFEPLAFGLERFDGLGTYLEIDQHGNPLRQDGNFLIPGTGDPIPYKTVGELMDLLAASERVQETMTWKLTQFALGRPLTAVDAPIVARIHESAQEVGGTYPAVMAAIASSDLVQTTRTEPRTTVTQ